MIVSSPFSQCRPAKGAVCGGTFERFRIDLVAKVSAKIRFTAPHSLPVLSERALRKLLADLRVLILISLIDTAKSRSVSWDRGGAPLISSRASLIVSLNCFFCSSLNLVRSPQLENKQKFPPSPLCSPVADHSISSLLDYTSSLENDNNLNSFLSSIHNTSPDSGVCGKMSSDSAFQSLGDGLELDQEDDKLPEVAPRSGKLETSKLELQMKAIAEEAKKMKTLRGNCRTTNCQFFNSRVI
jgi:hypothetical protein